MKKRVSPDTLQRWRKFNTDHPALPVVSESGYLTKADITLLVQEMNRLEADSVRIDFVRYKPLTENDDPIVRKETDNPLPTGCRWIIAGDGLSQIGVSLTPTKGYKVDATYMVSASEIVEDDGLLNLILPGEEFKGPTAINPPSSTATVVKTKG